MPVFGGIAHSFGRKPVLLAAITIFAVGSAICGSSNGMDQMIAGRTIQGVGVSMSMSMSVQINSHILSEKKINIQED